MRLALVRRGLVKQARRGAVGLGPVRQVRRGLVWSVKVWRGEVKQVWSGEARCGWAGPSKAGKVW